MKLEGNAMKNIKRSLVIVSFLIIIVIFMGAVSATSLNLTEAELASSGVKTILKPIVKYQDMYAYPVKT